jgi:hypothetical protein
MGILNKEIIPFLEKRDLREGFIRSSSIWDGPWKTIWERLQDGRWQRETEILSSTISETLQSRGSYIWVILILFS